MLKAPIRPPRVNVLGVGIHALNMELAVEFLMSSIPEGQRGYVCITGVHGVMEAQKDNGLRRIFDKALLVTPDGMPTVWLGHLQKFPQMKRVFGPDLMLEVCARSVRSRFTHFLYGGKPGVAEQLKRNLMRSFPGLRVVGTFTPPFRPLNGTERNQLKAHTAKLRPDFIWVGLSTPKQERFMHEMIDELTCKVMIGVGAAFDIHTGHLKDAPDWVKNAGLQWAHRLCQEPRRLWRRYLIHNTMFLCYLGLQFSGVRTFALSPESGVFPSGPSRLY